VCLGWISYNICEQVSSKPLRVFERQWLFAGEAYMSGAKCMWRLSCWFGC